MPEGRGATVLAFDFGLQRIGVAVGEAELGTAHPLAPIAAPGFDSISRLISEWRPSRLVVGLPVAANGEHPLAKRVERFARQLEGRFALPVVMVDERWTTQDAQVALDEAGTTGRKGKAVRDQVAAQLILQRWFDERPDRDS